MDTTQSVVTIWEWEFSDAIQMVEVETYEYKQPFLVGPQVALLLRRLQ